MKKKLIFISLITFFLSSFLVFGQAKTDLRPVQEMMGKEDPRELSKKVEYLVELTAGSDMWDGKEAVEIHTVPLRITIDNANDFPIVINYGSFRLENSEGHAYKPIPLFEIDFELERIVVEDEYDLLTPTYYWDEYFIYPLYAPVYDDVDITEFEYMYDSEIQEKFFMWEAMDADLPTENMRQQALPEGILDSDGIISGFLFFEDVNPDDEKVNLEFDVHNAETGEEVGTVSIPFYVME